MSIIKKIKSIFLQDDNGLVEHRVHPRVHASMKVTYSLEQGVPKENIALLNQTKNISAGGICLIIYEKLAKDTVLFLDIVLSDDYVLKVKSKVAWQMRFKEDDGMSRYETGVKFVDMDEEGRDYLIKYIASLEKNI